MSARVAVVAELAWKRRFGDNKLRAGRETEARIDGAEDADGTGADGSGEMQRAGINADHASAALQKACAFHQTELPERLQCTGDRVVLPAVDKVPAAANLDDGKAGIADEHRCEVLPMLVRPFTDGSTGAGVQGDDAAPCTRGAKPFGKLGIAHGSDLDARRGIGRERDADAPGHFFHEATGGTLRVVFVKVAEAAGIEPPPGEDGKAVTVKDGKHAINTRQACRDRAKLRAGTIDQMPIGILLTECSERRLAGDDVAQAAGSHHNQEALSTKCPQHHQTQGNPKDIGVNRSKIESHPRRGPQSRHRTEKSVCHRSVFFMRGSRIAHAATGLSFGEASEGKSFPQSRQGDFHVAKTVWRDGGRRLIPAGEEVVVSEPAKVGERPLDGQEEVVWEDFNDRVAFGHEDDIRKAGTDDADDGFRRGEEVGLLADGQEPRFDSFKSIALEKADHFIFISDPPEAVVAAREIESLTRPWCPVRLEKNPADKVG